jgi:hypothetical protein
MDYPKLQAEVNGDPVALGYAGKTDQQIADLLNSTTTGRTLLRTSISQLEFANAVGDADFPATATLQAKFQFLYSQAQINPNNAQMVAIIKVVFPTNTATWARLVALAQPTVNRATELGLGASMVGVTALDVNKAKAGLW